MLPILPPVLFLILLDMPNIRECKYLAKSSINRGRCFIFMVKKYIYMSILLTVPEITKNRCFLEAISFMLHCALLVTL